MHTSDGMNRAGSRRGINVSTCRSAPPKVRSGTTNSTRSGPVGRTGRAALPTTLRARFDGDVEPGATADALGSRELPALARRSILVILGKLSSQPQWITWGTSPT